MRLDKKFLARLLGVDESKIASISGLSFKADLPDNLSSFRDLLNDRHRRSIEALAKVLRNEDDLGKIVRAHIHIEHELQEFIFFAAPNPTQLKNSMEYSERVQLALVLGLNAELKPALTAAGTLRNNFSHRLDMKIGEEEAKNLIATVRPAAKQRFQTLLKESFSALPSAPELSGNAKAYFLAQMQMIAFFLRLFDDLAEERHRVAFEKMQNMAWH
jgi:hypothetical protein